MKKILIEIQKEIDIKEKILKSLREQFDKMDANHATTQGRVAMEITKTLVELKALHDFYEQMK
jgi:hypothetical protein